MKKISIFSLAAATVLAASCDFLELQPTDKITADNLFKTEEGIQAYLANLYYQMPIEDFAFAPTQGFHYQIGDSNNNGAYAWKDTDDVVGSQIQDAGSDSDYDWWEAGYVLNNNVNCFLSYIPGLSVDDKTKTRLTGEAWFIRGQLYFALAKRYGGVPIIEKVGDADDPSTLNIPRSTEVETWKYVLKCFDNAAEYLKNEEEDANRRSASRMVSYGYKARAALHAASLAKFWYNEGAADNILSSEAVVKGYVGGFTADDQKFFYSECISACDTLIKSGKFSLYGASPATRDAAIQNLADMFDKPDKALSTELIFVKGFKKTGVDYGTNQDNWCTPAQTAGSWPHPGRINPTIEYAENFEYIPGTEETFTTAGGATVTKKYVLTEAQLDEKGVDINNNGKFETYRGDAFQYIAPADKATTGGYQEEFDSDYYVFDDPKDFFKCKDARLEAYCIVPNSTFKGTQILIQGGCKMKSGTVLDDVSSGSKIVDGGVTYYPFGAADNTLYSGFSMNGGNNTRTGFLLRKYLSTTYVCPGPIWNQSTTDWIDLRYAEILLSYAEAVYEARESGFALGDEAQAKECLNATRHRAYLNGDVALTRDNIRRERRAEFGISNCRSWDVNRWRIYHVIFNGSGYRRGSLTPIYDYNTGKYFFVREKCQNTSNMIVSTRRYYRSIPGISGNGLTQNPQY